MLEEYLAARRSEILFSIILPVILSYLLFGVRLASGLVWIVLVSVEVLGVQDELGYIILDTRDRMDYGEFGGCAVYRPDWLPARSGSAFAASPLVFGLRTMRPHPYTMV